MNQVSQVEYGNEKTISGIRMNDEAQLEYLELDKQIKNEIEETKCQIQKYKELLEKVQEERKNTTEYNALARIIKTKPDRKKMEGRKDVLNKDLKDLKVSSLYKWLFSNVILKIIYYKVELANDT